VILVIDNYDSFTWNLVQFLGELGGDPTVIRNDERTVEEIRELRPERIVLSPGPCTPAEAGVSIEVARELGRTIPILGVCLGHQAIGEAFGGRTVRASRVMHGKTTRIRHTGTGLFQGLPQPLEVARYHSLVTDPGVLPDSLEPVAWSPVDSGGPDVSSSPPADEVQAIRHREFPIWGVQFHPESLFSEGGMMLLKNFLEL
jgi:anthranilate synthase component II